MRLVDRSPPVRRKTRDARPVEALHDRISVIQMPKVAAADHQLGTRTLRKRLITKTSSLGLVRACSLRREEIERNSMTQKLKFALLTLLLGGAAWFTPTARATSCNDPSDTGLPSRANRQDVTFEERAPGLPQAIHTWFYPGDKWGFELVYPKAEPQIVAKAAEPAPAPEPSAPQAAPEQPVVEQPAPEQPKEEVVVREPEVIIAQSAPPLDSAPPAELPKTAGYFAMIPLLGIVLLSAGFTAFRFARKQS
jgi:hypothetical protein